MKITPEEVKRSGELQTVEFKKSLSLRKEACEALCGMVNADSAIGTVLFGVDPDGSIAGIEPGNLDSAQKGLTEHIRQKFDPKLIHEIHVVECSDKQLLLVRASRAKETPYHEYDGRAYIREGTTRRMLGVAEKDQLRKKRNRDSHNGPWKCDRCNTWLGGFNGVEFTDQGPKKTYKCGCGGEYWPV